MDRAVYLWIVLCFVATAALAQDRKKPTITGSLTLSGALSGTFSWEPDLALTCGCGGDPKNPVGVADVTMTNGAGVFIAVKSNINGELTLTSGKLKSTFRGKGKTGTCTQYGPSALSYKMNLPIDVTVTSQGESVTVKGTLAAACPY